MSLVRLERSDGSLVYVNAKHVVAIGEHDRELCILEMVNDTDPQTCRFVKNFVVTVAAIDEALQNE